MSEQQPFFPPPRPKGDVSYREPGRDALASDTDTATTASAASDIEPTNKKIVVHRPDEPSKYVDGARVATTRPSEVAESEHTFWQRHSFLANYPRPVGGVLTVLGGLITYASLSTLRHGGAYVPKWTMLAPMMLCWGIFLLAAGYPMDVRGRPPTWWGTCAFGVMLLGVAGGVVLLAVLTR